MTAPDQFKNDTMFDWVECYGGPADGETVPVDPMDPLPEFPYQTTDQVVHWYRLRISDTGQLRFYLVGFTDQPGWAVVQQPND
jgi:hypothetical protein